MSFNKSLSGILGLVGTTALLTLSGCADGGVATVTAYKGAVALDRVKVDLPQHVFDDAIVSFVQDPDAKWGGTSYVSRVYDQKGGQYVVACKDDRCFKVDVLYREHPVDKEYAIKLMQQLAPVEKDTTTKQTEKKAKSEIYMIGDRYKGQIHFSDPDHTQADMITTFAMNQHPAAESTPKETAPEGTAKPQSNG